MFPTFADFLANSSALSSRFQCVGQKTSMSDVSKLLNSQPGLVFRDVTELAWSKDLGVIFFNTVCLQLLSL